MLTNPAVTAYASLGNAEPKRKEVKSVEKTSGLLSRSRNVMSSDNDTEKELNENLREYVLQIRNKRKELRNGRS
tara:strand:+ start:2045 stop:2266 length:222 start_codon:yes stop_codon:yes gene_type:complete